MHWRFATGLLIAVAAIVPNASLPLSLGPRPAQAMTAVELSLGDLVQGSTMVIAGTPVESRSLWEDTDPTRGQRIVTYTRMQVDEVLDGEIPTEPVWVRTLGGHVGDIGQRVEGEVVFQPSQSAVIFLRRRTDATHSIVGMSQGHYPLETRPTEPGLRRLSTPPHLDALVARIGHALGEKTAARVTLAGHTISEVRTLIQTERSSHAR